MKLLRFIAVSGAVIGLVTACAMPRKQPVFSDDHHVGAYKVGEPYQIDGTWYTPQVDEDYEEEGVASWYGPGFHGKLTANGDEFDQHALTAAHRTLPMPSMVRVTNLDNGRSLAVMVNDRGPFSKGRILDLSERAADILGFKDNGIANVKVKFLPGQTRRLLSQLEVPKGGRNPFATNDENFGMAEAGGLDLPVPDHFDVSMFDEPAVETSGDPIGLEPPFAPKQAEVANVSNAEVKPISVAEQLPWEENQAVVEARVATPSQIDILPESLPETASAKEVVLKEDAIEVNDIAALEVPEGKMLIDEHDPRFVKDVYFIQVGSYGVKANALRAQETLLHLGEKVEVKVIETDSGSVSRVKMGPIYKEARAKQLAKEVATMGYPDALVVGD